MNANAQLSDSAPAQHHHMTGTPGSRRTVLTIALALAALAAAIAIWFAVTDDEEAQTLRPGEPVLITHDALRTFVKDAPVPVFWAGERPNTELEYTETSDKRTFVRYLTGSAKAGDPRAVFVSVATYPRPEALTELKGIANRKGVTSAPVPGGGLYAYYKTKPLSVYVAYPDKPVMIEVYAAKAGDARGIARSGDITPVR
ncbi:MAG: hypothetical protein M3356_01085 [Actinomycetota bacterium]|nr:hypothetical protein [Actinomycetota bacterium]